ncbi:hypothetical protein ACWDCL_01900 [Streptomyces sp. NPDC001009]
MSSRLPWYAYVTGAIVLIVALAMSAPGEYELAHAAGWSAEVAVGMPVCMSVYTAFAVWFVETLPKGQKGRGTAIVGAALALAMTLSGQVVAHWIAAGYMHPSKALTACVSSVPSIVVGHVAHMIIRAARRIPVEVPQVIEHQDQGQADEGQDQDRDPVQPTLDGTEPPADEVAKARARRRPGRPAPSLDEIKEAAKALVAKGEPLTGPNLAKVMGRDRRTGSRYLQKLDAATA